MVERNERLEDALRRIANKRAHEVLKANGMTLDRLSAAAMRHVVTGVGRIAADALSE